jgi:hypothetical protein
MTNGARPKVGAVLQCYRSLLVNEPNPPPL